MFAVRYVSTGNQKAVKRYVKRLKLGLKKNICLKKPYLDTKMFEHGANFFVDFSY